MMILPSLQAKAKPWFEIKAAASADAPVDVLIYDEISPYGVGAEDFVKALQGISAKQINLRINSPGGSVFDGTAIFNAIKAHPANVTAYIDGVAASIASVIALAADEVVMAENAFYMIHNPWAFAIGDASEMRKMADVLDKIGGTLANTYAAKSGKPLAEIKALMAAETWFTAAEALAAGFVDKVDGEPDEDDQEDGKNASASHDLSMYRNAPKDGVSGGHATPDEDHSGVVQRMQMRVRLAVSEG